MCPQAAAHRQHASRVGFDVDLLEWDLCVVALTLAHTAGWCAAAHAVLLSRGHDGSSQQPVWPAVAAVPWLV